MDYGDLPAGNCARRHGPFQLKVYPTHIVAATRGEDAGGMYLRLADGTELDGATLPAMCCSQVRRSSAILPFRLQR